VGLFLHSTHTWSHLMHEHIKGTWVRRGGENYSHKTTLVHCIHSPVTSWTYNSECLHTGIQRWEWGAMISVTHRALRKELYNQWGCTTRESHCLQGTVTLYSAVVRPAVQDQRIYSDTGSSRRTTFQCIINRDIISWLFHRLAPANNNRNEPDFRSLV